MVFSRYRFLGFISVLLLLGGASCRKAQPIVAVVPTVAQTAVLPTAPPPTPLPPLPTPYLTIPLTATPTVLPTPTPLPLHIAVLPEWETAVRTATNANDPPWQITVHEQPATLLQSGAVDAVLDWNQEGILIRQTPIVLAVPFMTNWESVTLAEAEQILANGHEAVTIQLWSDMPHTHKALRIDGRSPADPTYPFQQRLTLAAVPGIETAVSTLATHLQATHPPNPVIQLAAVGDIMLDRALGSRLIDDPTFPFAQITPLLQQADITVGNIESAIGDTGTPAAKSYTFRAPPEAANVLALAGFDIVSLANNHALDYGPEALRQGMELLERNRITPVGAGANAGAAHAPAITQINGLTLAFLGYLHVPVESRGFDTETWTATVNTPGLAWAQPEQIMADVTAVQSQADVVIVLLHSGYEYVEAPSPPQIAAAHAAIDAGADLVIGHHAHILQGVEFYKDGVIVYGLGNFAFEIDGEPETAVLHAWLTTEGVREITFTPAIVQFGGQPRLATPAEAFTIRQKIVTLSTYLIQK